MLRAQRRDRTIGFFPRLPRQLAFEDTIYLGQKPEASRQCCQLYVQHIRRRALASFHRTLRLHITASVPASVIDPALRKLLRCFRGLTWFRLHQSGGERSQLCRVLDSMNLGKQQPGLRHCALGFNLPLVIPKKMLMRWFRRLFCSLVNLDTLKLPRLNSITNTTWCDLLQLQARWIPHLSRLSITSVDPSSPAKLSLPSLKLSPHTDTLTIKLRRSYVTTLMNIPPDTSPLQILTASTTSHLRSLAILGEWVLGTAEADAFVVLLTRVPQLTTLRLGVISLVSDQSGNGPLPNIPYWRLVADAICKLTQLVRLELAEDLIVEQLAHLPPRLEYFRIQAIHWRELAKFDWPRSLRFLRLELSRAFDNQEAFRLMGLVLRDQANLVSFSLRVEDVHDVVTLFKEVRQPLREVRSVHLHLGTTDRLHYDTAYILTTVRRVFPGTRILVLELSTHITAREKEWSQVAHHFIQAQFSSATLIFKTRTGCYDRTTLFEDGVIRE